MSSPVVGANIAKQRSGKHRDRDRIWGQCRWPDSSRRILLLERRRHDIPACATPATVPVSEPGADVQRRSLQQTKIFKVDHVPANSSAPAAHPPTVEAAWGHDWGHSWGHESEGSSNSGNSSPPPPKFTKTSTYHTIGENKAEKHQHKADQLKALHNWLKGKGLGRAKKQAAGKDQTASCAEQILLSRLLGTVCIPQEYTVPALQAKEAPSSGA